MNFDEVKDYLKKNYSENDYTIVDEHPKELYLKAGDITPAVFKVNEKEILEFSEFLKIKDEFANSPNECSICSVNYREQMIRDLSITRWSYLWKDGKILLNKTGDRKTHVEVSPASKSFFNFFRFHPFFLRQIKNRQYFYKQEGETLLNNINFPLTIKIFEINSHNIETALSDTQMLIESCLFEIAYLKDTTLQIIEEWPQRYGLRKRNFRFDEYHTEDHIRIPKVNYNQELVRFYLRGLRTDDPVNQFLSHYQVLEYYFVRISDEKLYEKLTSRFNDPKFTTTPKYLDRVIHDTINHKRETDEQQMLRLVLEKFIDEQELIEFITDYENYLSEKFYTKKHKIFSKEVEVKLEEGHILGNIAKRIKIIRNAIVHSSDRYEREERYVPSLTSEKFIRLEIPLMRFLAEKVIIANPL